MDHRAICRIGHSRCKEIASLWSLGSGPVQISRVSIASAIVSASSRENLGQYKLRLATSTFSVDLAGRAKDAARAANASACAFCWRGTSSMKKLSNFFCQFNCLLVIGYQILIADLVLSPDLIDDQLGVTVCFKVFDSNFFG